MGITGLLPLLKDIACDVHLRTFSGKVAAIDVYCWLHKTVIFCVEERILGSKQRGMYQHFVLCLILNVSFSLALFSPQIFFFRYIDMCIKDTDPLIENNVQPIPVFQKKLEGPRWRARQM